MISLNRYAPSVDSPFAYVRIFIRFLQFVLALTVAGLYGVDLDRARKAGVYADGKWVWAEVTAGVSCITVLVYAIPFFKTWAFFALDIVVFIFWLVVFGIFGKMYIPEDAEGNKGIQRMKNAVWVDLTNMLLWFGTAVYSTFIFFKYRHQRTLHTSRAQV